MPSPTNYIEAALGTIFSFSKNHDSQLLSQVCSSVSKIPPSVTLSSTELGQRSPGRFTAGKHELLGENIFPTLAWHMPDSDRTSIDVKSWLLVVEDPDSPLPKPGVHGIFYDIPGGKMNLGPEDLEEVAGGERNLLRGGFKFGERCQRAWWKEGYNPLVRPPESYMLLCFLRSLYRGPGALLALQGFPQVLSGTVQPPDVWYETISNSSKI